MRKGFCTTYGPGKARLWLAGSTLAKKKLFLSGFIFQSGKIRIGSLMQGNVLPFFDITNFRLYGSPIILVLRILHNISKARLWLAGSTMVKRFIFQSGKIRIKEGLCMERHGHKDDLADFYITLPSCQPIE